MTTTAPTSPWQEFKSELLPVRVGLSAGFQLVLQRLARRSSRSFRMDNAMGIGFANAFVDFEGRDVLEIGGCTPEAQAVATRCRSWLASDIKSELPESTDARYRVARQDARSLTLEDESVDIVFSISALEHFPEPDRCLREVFRVLRPSGVFWTNFGPIWSGPIGHHVWFRHAGRRYTFNDGFLEPWEHLLYSPDELEARVARRMDPEVAKLAVASIFSDGNNRVHCDDYLRAIRSSGLAVAHFDKRRIRVPNSEQTQTLLSERYPHNGDFETNGIRMLLQKL